MGHVVITGISRGIGRALAQEALARGHRVTGTTRDGAAPFEAPGLAVLACDVSQTASVRAAAAGVSGPVDVLVCNAGIYGDRSQTLAGLDPDALLQVLDVNVAGPFRTLQALAPALSPQAKVLMISSGMGRFSGGGTGAAAYRASKAALNKLVQTLQPELGERVLVACHPGWVRTDMGGQGADIAPEESARGLLDLAERLQPGEGGAFHDWTGARRDW